MRLLIRLVKERRETAPEMTIGMLHLISVYQGS